MFEEINEIPLCGISQRLHWDYTYFTINGIMWYFWALKCAITKAIVGWIITCTKSIDDAKASLLKAKHTFPVVYELKEIVSDGEPSFPRAIWEVFDHSVKHYRYKGFRDKKNNNLIETLWRFKNHVPEFRTPEQANRFFAMWVALYNIGKLKHLQGSVEVYNLKKALILRHF